MSYPLGVVTRTITVGDSITVESGTDLTVRATLRSSRGLVWVATGERAVAAPEVKESVTAGDAVTFAPPVTDQAGWRDLATGSLIDVSTPNAHTHTYTIELVTLRDGQPMDRRLIGPFALPTGDGSQVDADLLVEADTVPGLLVPDALTPRMDALESEMSNLGGSIPAAVADYLTTNPPSGSPDATALTKGIVRLAGDLGGTADAPTVPGLADKADADHTHILADITDYTAPPPPPDLSGYATTSAVASALAGKADTGHGHTIADVSGLQSALDGKAPALGADDNYVTDAEKANLHTHPAVIAQGATAAAARTTIGAAPASHEHTAADIDSGAATDGHILTADGAGGTAWEAPPAGGGGDSGVPAPPILLTRGLGGVWVDYGGQLTIRTIGDPHQSGLVHLLPLLMPYNGVVTAMGQEVAVAAVEAGGVLRMGLYAHDYGTGKAGALLGEVAPVTNLTTVGHVSCLMPAPIPVQAGRVYWTAVQVTGSPPRLRMAETAFLAAEPYGVVFQRPSNPGLRNFKAISSAVHQRLTVASDAPLPSDASNMELSMSRWMWPASVCVQEEE